MKILVLQLTRFGDILCTLPALSALRRENPEAEIHFLVRQRFAAAAATETCPHVDHLWKLDTVKILGPLISPTPAGDGELNGPMMESLAALNRLVQELRAQKFDKVINLSFSPSSSFLTHLIARESIPVAGYTRTPDLYLRIPDKASEYFRAQVGVDRHNRLHVVDLLAQVAGVELKPADFQRDSDPDSVARSGIVCHMGASRKTKTWPESSWVALIRKLLDQGENVTLVGGAEERAAAENVALQATLGGKPALRNLVGETSSGELVKIMAGASLFIGADSGPLHAAGLGGCRSLNLSVGKVRFWETGPVVVGSRVIVRSEPQYIASDEVYEQARQMLRGENPRAGYIECVNTGGPRYVVHPGAYCPNDYWALVDWIYFQGPRPHVGGEVATALAQIDEICGIALSQLEKLYKAPQNAEIVNVLDRLDDLLEIFRANLAPLTPLLEAFRVMKENIPPASRDEIFFQTGNCYKQLKKWAGELLFTTNIQSVALEAKG